MKRTLFLITFLIFISFNSWAKHEKGGWILYEYKGPGASANTSIYKITITYFFSCTTTGPRDITLSIYDSKTFSRVANYSIGQENNEVGVTKKTYSPCLSNPPTICYLIDTYTKTVTLPDDANGYTIGVTSSGHRVEGIVNIYDAGCSDCQNKTQTCYSSCATGLAMTAEIPGTINGVDYHINSSPKFLFKDTAVICFGSYFEYQFAAIDTLDHDSLSYSFGAGQDGAKVTTPPFPSVTYAHPFSSDFPMGNSVTIDPTTGLISGKAPSILGEYIIDVYVKEWRNGVLIDSVKKELQIDVNDCSLLSAELQKVYVNCDSLTLSFQNLSTASNITKYIWNFGDVISTNNISTTPIVTHTFTKAGDYSLSLYVANNDGCNNTTTAIVKVYPGFTPKFKVDGSCYQSPILFTDATFAKYGAINSWLWDFGDPSSANNSAITSSTSHLYGKAETIPVILKVGSSVGCSGSDTIQVVVNDKPNIILPFPDTLICSNDTLPLIAKIDANALSYDWFPTTNMINPQSLNPRVYPQDTTSYTLTVHQNGCVGSASIKVNVLQFITVAFSPDTMHVCLTDSVKLNPISHALSYKWKESSKRSTLDYDTLKNPKASPIDTVTTYFVTANLGHCPAKDSVKVYASPYPKVKILSPIKETTICYGDSLKLKASKVGATAIWSPVDGLVDNQLLSQIAKPTTNTTYTLTVKDTLYCPKSVSDSVVINVIPEFSLSAGNDTAVVVSEPLQLYATITDTSFKYPVTYNWTPTSLFINPTIQNPIANATSAVFDTIRITAKTIDHQCIGTGKVYIRFFSTKPDIFVPSAFLPNGSYPNKILIPTPVGIAHFEYFKVFNRWGQLVYSTSKPNEGWDGTWDGVIQNSGTYVYMAQGIDYLKNVISRKGTVVLIR